MYSHASSLLTALRVPFLLWYGYEDQALRRHNTASEDGLTLVKETQMVKASELIDAGIGFVITGDGEDYQLYEITDPEYHAGDGRVDVDRDPLCDTTKLMDDVPVEKSWHCVETFIDDDGTVDLIGAEITMEFTETEFLEGRWDHLLEGDLIERREEQRWLAIDVNLDDRPWGEKTWGWFERYRRHQRLKRYFEKIPSKFLARKKQILLARYKESIQTSKRCGWQYLLLTREQLDELVLIIDQRIVGI